MAILNKFNGIKVVTTLFIVICSLNEERQVIMLPQCIYIHINHKLERENPTIDASYINDLIITGYCHSIEKKTGRIN